jgi:tetratricopeptide (TPR) repeat protein
VEEAAALLRMLAADVPDRAEPLMQLGDLLRINERFEEAAEAYHAAEARIGQLEDHHWSLLYYRAIAYERAGEWPRAEADFLAALEMRPDEPYLLNYLGYSWVDRGEHLDRAREMIELAVELRPNDGFITDSLGWVLYRLDDVQGAVEHLEAAIELEPGDPVINDHLGDAYWFAGRRLEARYQWQRALDSDPEPELEAVIRGKLATATGSALPTGLVPPGPVEPVAGTGVPDDDGAEAPDSGASGRDG